MPSVGEPMLRVDAIDKVTGRAAYLPNFSVAGMAHASVFRSTAPHALIRSIQAEAARQSPGVLSVTTGDDLARLMAEPYWGPAVVDQSPLAIGRVRYVGEPVAAIVADTPEQAEAAMSLLDVEYEDLPAVFDPFEAREPGSPLLYDQVRPARAFADLAELRPAEGTNVNIHYRLRRGDVDAGMAAADLVVEETYSYSRNQFCALEPHLTIASIGEDGRITVWSNTQSPHIVRSFISTMFGVAPEGVRVLVGQLGGGYGGKTYMKLEPLAVALAKHSGRPVRLALTQEEEFYLVNNHAATVRMRSGVTKEGWLTAADCEIVWDSGAYADIGPRIAQKSGMTAVGPYDVPNVRIDSFSVYTNLPPTGPIRGFGIPQVSWAYESQMDVIARRLGMDPLALRRINLLRSGAVHSTGTVMRGVNLQAQLDAVEAALGSNGRPDKAPDPTPRLRRGRGFAIGLKAVLTPSASDARIELDANGIATVFASAVEMGQGTSTILTQIVADGLGVPPSRVKVVFPDTDFTPYDLLTAGSRTTHHVGRAVLDAAQDLRRQVISSAAELLGEAPSSLDLVDGDIVSRLDPATRLSAGELVRRVAEETGRFEGKGHYQTDYQHADPATGQSPMITNHWFSGAAAVEVEVDTATGQVRVDRLIVEGDAGHAINPANCHRQLSGAAVMGLGHTLMEEVLFDSGQPTNASFLDYRIPSIRDVPLDLVSLVHETEAVGGPSGAKGLGETGILAIAPAIANAIEDAVGVRLRALPITPERVYEALQAAEARRGERSS